MPVQRQENKTGLPERLRFGLESLSGLDLSDVRVHRNSSKPAFLQALAYTQGTDIHVGPGQERHLPHEAWHVVQQKQGRVQPTVQAKRVSINDDPALEREADLMGEKAATQKSPNRFPTLQGKVVTNEGGLKSLSVGAGRQPVQLRHDVFNKSNMIFATNDPARLPSFYFSTDGKNSYRVRQQHGRGPTIEKKGTNVQHYFFSKDRDKKDFYAAAVAGELDDAQSVERSIVPHTDDFHVEYQIGRLTETAHKSGGRIIKPADFNYEDDDYEEMATAVEAWKEKEKRKPDFGGKKKRGEYADITVPRVLDAP